MSEVALIKRCRGYVWLRCMGRVEEVEAEVREGEQVKSRWKKMAQED